MTFKAIVYYPFYPKYRKEILSCLAHSTDVEFDLAAGTIGKAGVDALTADDLPEMCELESWQVGPFTFQKRITRLAVGEQYGAAIIAPATLSISAWGILIGRRLRGLPTYLWGQCGRPHSRGLKRYVQEVMNRLATGLLVYGEMESNAACELGLNPNKVSIVRNANKAQGGISCLTTESFRQITKRRGIGAKRSGSTVNILFVGRITAEKRLDRLVGAVELLHRAGVDARATIVGGGAWLEELRSLVDAQSFPIQAPGAVYSDEALAHYFDEADVVVAPNSIGLLAVDALRHGVPVIYPDNLEGNGPEVESLTEGVNSVKFACLSPEGISESIEHWLQLSPRIDFKEFEMVTRDAVSKWKPDRVAERIARAVKTQDEVQIA